MKESILITGAGGFVGSHLAMEILNKTKNKNVVCLVKSYKTLIVDRIFNAAKESGNRFHLVFGDITNINTVRDLILTYNIDLVYHLAAKPIVSQAQKDITNTIDVNILGTANILELCRSEKFRLVLQTTDKVYGNKENAKIGDPFVPVDFYGITKVTVERMAIFYRQTYNLDIIVTRPCNIIGFDLHFSRLIPSLIKSCLEGKDPVINYPTDGVFMSRQFIHVWTVVSSLRFIGLEDIRPEKEYNMGSPFIYNTKEIAEFILEEFPSLSLKYRNRDTVEIAKQSLDSKVDSSDSLADEFRMILHLLIQEYREELKL